MTDRRVNLTPSWKAEVTEQVVSPSPLSIDDLNAMPMDKVFKLVKHIESTCNQAVKDLKTHSHNMQVIQKFIKDNMSV
jgi:hypothetical protein